MLFYYIPDCDFQGIKFKHGDYKYVSVAGAMICLRCACYRGHFRCIFAHVSAHQICYNIKDCTSLANSKNVTEGK